MTIDTSREAVERLNTHRVYIDRTMRFDEGITWTTVAGFYPHAYVPEDFALALLARAEAAEAREQALLTSYDEERKALVESASLRERLKAAEELLQFIAEVAPVADKTCDEPGITFVEACRREMKERGK